MAGSEVATAGQPSAASQALATRAPWWMLPNFGLVIVGIFCAALFGAFWIKSDQLILFMCTAATVALTQVLNFFYGSSQGSRQNADDAARATAALAQSTPPATVAAMAASTAALATISPVEPAAPAPAALGAMRPTGIS